MPSYQRLLIASSKGGVGKSTTAVGLATSFAREGKPVLLIDLDTTSRSLELLAGAADTAVTDLCDALGENATDALVRPMKDFPTLAFLPAPTEKRLSEVAKERSQTEGETVRQALEAMLATEEFDYVVCDTGGGLGYALDVADLFDLTLITSEQSKTSVRSAENAATLLSQKGAGEIRLVICSFDAEAVQKENRAGVIEMIDASVLACIGVVPFDKTLQQAQDGGTIPSGRSLSTIAYRNIAHRIKGEEITLFHGMGKLERRRKKAF